jgi:hypothetical protein
VRPAPDTAAVLLGALTLVLTVVAAVLSRASTGPAALVAGIVSLAGLAATAGAFFVALARSPVRRRGGLGLGLALGAWPVAALLTTAVWASR